jgi:carbon monoxide dehydrogenase subunit G
MKAALALALAAGLLVARVAAAPSAEGPVLSVRDERGTYIVSARFSVVEPPDTVRAVLTNYEEIARFMPGVQTSRVLERGEGYVRVEQEAVSKFLMFSKRVHLVLDVTEDADAIRFRDQGGRSFERYEGTWMIAGRGERTDIEYLLTAKPAFDVPGFVLRRLLDRDARAMIDGLRAELLRAAAR